MFSSWSRKSLTSVGGLPSPDLQNRFPKCKCANFHHIQQIITSNHANRSAQRTSGPQTSSATTATSAIPFTSLVTISSVLSLFVWPNQNFSGHQRLNNHFKSNISEDYVVEVNLSNLVYDIGPPLLPQRSQESWISLVPQPFAPSHTHQREIRVTHQCQGWRQQGSSLSASGTLLSSQARSVFT